MSAKTTRTNLLLDRLSKVYENSCAPQLMDVRQLNAKRILVIAPHADDEVIGCGAAITHFAQKGADICVLIVTQESERSIAKAYDYTPEQRIKESYLAKSVLGYNELVYFDFPELLLRRNLLLQEKFCKELKMLIKEKKPDCIFIPNTNEFHPDHKVIGLLSHKTISEGIKTNSFVGLDTMMIYEIWGSVLMNSYLEISEEAYSKKIESIQCYESQMSSVDYEQIIQFIGGNRGRILKEAKGGHAILNNRLAEGYKLYHNEELLNAAQHV